MCTASRCRIWAVARVKKEEIVMGDKGSKDKGGKEQKKKPKLTLKEKRKQKREKETK